MAYLNTVLGAELQLLGDEQFSGRFCLLTRKQDNLSIKHIETVKGNLVAVINAWPKAFPVALTLTGKGIIHKNIKVETAMADDELFRHTFPAIAQKDFYIQQFNQTDALLISIIRKQMVDELYDKLKLAGINIYSLSLGAMVTAHIWPQLNLYDAEIQFDGHVFGLTAEKQFEGYHFDAAVKNKFPVKVEQEEIPETNILAYAAAFQLLLHEGHALITADVDVVNAGFEDLLTRLKLKKQGFVFLLAIFGVLMVSFLLFTHYNQENAVLVQQVGTQTANADQADLMKKNSLENEMLLKKINWNGGYNYGFLLNEIGQSLPRQLQMQEIAMNDFNTETEKRERLPNIKIRATTVNLTAVNNWIFVLQEKKWIKTVKLLKYQKDTESETYQLNLIITY